MNSIPEASYGTTEFGGYAYCGSYFDYSGFGVVFKVVP